ncbi:uncharacterized protein LOC128719060 [Anopheles marshallii]|uniref:uncharacterized protein LOC128719060 n=1 Tax=Anopheles marshallii TaxID=1521116 RepID=UPI00237BFEE9|nr:uncharacterized protein LOC128719060 [Anopheles marshallii]
MANSLVETLFEAITIGDETILEQCIQQATIDTVLEFRRSYGESPLHLCVKIGGVSHLGVVRCLLASGLFDSTTVDSEGQTVLECALANEDSELVEALINVEIDGLDDATACYQMLRHNSLQIFKKFLQMKQLKEEDEFQHIASALVQLSVKNVVLSEDLRLFTLWKLSDFGFRKLSGNWPGTKDPNEWKNHVDVISDCWRDINVQHNTRLYADVDDLFLHRLQTVHNHLYFLKHKQFLAHLPMQEAIFCVAIFLSIFRNPEQFQEYRLMVNKCLVIEFVRMVSEQLAIVRKYLEGTETELLSIVRQSESSGSTEKDKLIQDLMAKIDSSDLPNKAHVLKQLKQRVESTTAANKDSLIKDMLDKVKRIDKLWTGEMADKIKQLDKTNREQLIEQIGKRLRHVSHPQNVVNRLIGDWKKGKATEAIVADIVAGESFNLSHLMRGKDRRIKRKLLKCYSKTKQYYSLYKTVFYCENIVRKPIEVPSQSTYAEIACMKRTVQVFGEAIKNTTNSANMPGKAVDAVNSMLTELFPRMNKSFREVFSHSISLKKQLLGESHDNRLFGSIRSHLGMMRMVFQLLYVVAVVDVRQSLYGYMRQCDTFRELQSLVLYIGDMEDLEQRQLACYKQVMQYFDEAKATFEELRTEPIGETPTFRHLQKQLQVKRDIVKKLENYFNENDGFNYGSIRRACFSSDDLAAIRRLLDWKLTMRWAGGFFQNVRSSWQTNHVESLTIEWKDQRLLKYNPAVIAGILKNGSTAMECIEEFEYIEQTRQLTVDLKIAEKIDEESLQHLNRRLKSYYNDIFFIDNKWKVLETFCKELKLPWNKELTRELIKRDQVHLQQLYDKSRNQLGAILEKYGLSTVDGLVTRLFGLPTRMLSAIEHIQLELCEMLYTVGYFGDSFHYLKSRIPMIQGKNYRNFLAHDTLSYNLLTDSSMEKIVINAFVFSNTEVRLFGNGGANKVHITLPTLSQMNHWVELQHRLLEAFRSKDIPTMQKIGREEGAEMKGRFCCTRNKSYLASAFFQLPELINPCNADMSVVEYLDQYFAGFLDRCNDPEYQVSTALAFRDFQAVYDRTIALGDRLIREEMFDWEELMTHVRKTDLFVHLVAVVNRGAILRMLIGHGNTAGVREMLPFFESFHTANDRGPLGDALLYCVRSITDLLLPRSSVPHPAILLLAIILHWNDIFTCMMAKADIEGNTFEFLLKTTVQARNYTAAVYLLENEAFTQFIPDAFVACCESAARMGEQSALQHLLVRCPTTSMETTSLAHILHQGALKQQWNCVQLLLERDVPVDLMFTDNMQEKQCTFLMLVKYGQCRLIQKIKSINHELFGTVAKHPFTVAVQNGMTSDRMIRSLRALGFDWLDSSTTLHAAIRSKNKTVFELIQKLVNENCVVNSSTLLDHFRHALIVLQRWKMISFVEESNAHGHSSLFCALQTGEQAMVKELLSWAHQMRTIEELGILGGVVFERDAAFTSYGKRPDGLAFWNTRDSCEDMITRMETCALLSEMIWQPFAISAQSSTLVTFHVLTTEDEVIEPFQDQIFNLRNSASLIENLKDFLSFVNASLRNFTIIFAEFSTDSGARRYFWQIEQISCMYEILLPSEKAIDLTDMVNYTSWRDETPLHHCFPRDTLEMVKLLVENGANPLLADSSGMAPIHLSLLNSLDYAVGRYLFDECVRKDLRNAKGCSVLELDDGNGGNRLIHTAIMAGRQDIIKRLLELHVDVSVVNTFGVAPAQLAASIVVQNTCRLVKLILDYDASSVDLFDHMDYTLLQCAARENSLELMQLVLQYKPNLQKHRNGMTALGIAILMKHIECAKCLVRYAIANNIRGITIVEENDLVILSLFCDDYDLSKMLLEYELGHTLGEVDERDLPRIKSILEGSLPVMPEVPIARVVQVQRYTESQNFMDELLVLATSVTDQ